MKVKGVTGVDSLIGTTLGGYKLTRAIGSGGMGTVYLAEDQSVGQQVAIKLVRTDDDDFADTFSRAEAIERFKQEARAIAKLDNLHILPLYRYGEEKVFDSLQAYMVMQYRPEGSLWDWLRRRAGQALGDQSQIADSGAATPLPVGLPTNWPLSVTEVADYLQQAASALQYAHDHGIIHRDVKPANFLLRFDTNNAMNTANAFLLLSDFGLAKFFSSGTASSVALGTPMYMAPEQFYSNAEPASDQYALAVMIYYMLAGRPPFRGDPARMMHQHLNVAPAPIRTLAPNLSSGIETVLNRALAKQVQDRYPRIDAFAEDFLQRINDTRQGHRVAQTLTAASYRPIAPTINAAPASPAMPPMAPQPQAIPYSGGQSPIPTTLDPAAMARTPASVPPPPPSFIPPSNAPIPSAQPSQPGNRYWNSDATIPEREQVSQPAEQSLRRPPNTNKNKVSRRGAVGWIVLGIAAVGIGTTASIVLYERRQAANDHRSGNNQQNPQQGQPTPQGITPKYVLTGHTDEVRSISWSPDTNQLASGSLDTTVRIWNIDTQKTTLIYPGHKQGVEAVAWDPDAQAELIASGDRENVVRIWDSTTGKNQIIAPNLESEVSSLAWLADNASVFVGTSGAGLHEITVGDKHATQIGPRNAIDTIAVSPDRNFLATGLKSGSVNVLALQDDKKSFPVLKRINNILGLAWSPDSSLLAMGGSDQTVDILDITSRRIVHSKKTNSSVNGLSWEPDNADRLAIAQADGTISIWDRKQDTLISGTGHTGPVTTIAWGPQSLASGASDKTIIVWNI